MLGLPFAVPTGLEAWAAVATAPDLAARGAWTAPAVAAPTRAFALPMLALRLGTGALATLLAFASRAAAG